MTMTANAATPPNKLPFWRKLADATFMALLVPDAVGILAPQALWAVVAPRAR